MDEEMSEQSVTTHPWITEVEELNNAMHLADLIGPGASSAAQSLAGYLLEHAAAIEVGLRVLAFADHQAPTVLYHQYDAEASWEARIGDGKWVCETTALRALRALDEDEQHG